MRRAVDARAAALRAAVAEQEQFQGRTAAARQQARHEFEARLQELAGLADGLAEARSSLGG
jgi:hypothetical protein